MVEGCWDQKKQTTTIKKKKIRKEREEEEPKRKRAEGGKILEGPALSCVECGVKALCHRGQSEVACNSKRYYQISYGVYFAV